MNLKKIEYLILSLIFLELGASFFSLNYFSIFICILSLYFISLLPKLEKNYKLYIPYELQLFVILFIFATLVLGELKNYYNLYWWWDLLLHFSSSVALAILIFGIILRLLRNEKLKASAVLISTFTLLIVIGIGGIWEIFEFTMDQLFNLDMQKTGLIDTMWDLIVAGVGALIVSISGFFYLKYEKINFLSNLIDKIFKNLK